MASQTAIDGASAGELPLAGTVAAFYRERHLALAEWHLSEAVLKLAVGEFENEAHHLSAALEFLSLAAGRKIAAPDVDALRHELQKEIDR